MRRPTKTWQTHSGHFGEQGCLNSHVCDYGIPFGSDMSTSSTPPSLVNCPRPSSIVTQSMNRTALGTTSSKQMGFSWLMILIIHITVLWSWRRGQRFSSWLKRLLQKRTYLMLKLYTLLYYYTISLFYYLRFLTFSEIGNRFQTISDIIISAQLYTVILIYVCCFFYLSSLYTSTSITVHYGDRYGRVQKLPRTTECWSGSMLKGSGSEGSFYVIQIQMERITRT